MEKTAIDDVPVEVNPLEVHDVRRPVSEALNTDHLAMNYFELDPGESFSGGLHAHHDQEELFYIESGTAAFDVGRERETITVEGGEVVRFSPGEFQHGYVPEDAEEGVVGWALGAPGSRHDWDDLESLVLCRECGEERVHDTTMTDDGHFRLTCTDCDTTFTL